MTQELLDAIAPGNTAPWLKYVDARFVHMDENGVVRNKDEPEPIACTKIRRTCSSTSTKSGCVSPSDATARIPCE